LQQLAIARADGTYANALARLAKINVLVVDDFLLAPMTDIERRDLLEGNNSPCLVLTDGATGSRRVGQGCPYRSY
jgi:hypothetical protein